jgi:hypothetical protein
VDLTDEMVVTGAIRLWTAKDGPSLRELAKLLNVDQVPLERAIAKRIRDDHDRRLAEGAPE